MKKSEMLGKLYNLLYKDTDLNEDSLEELCIKILDEVEENGMAPPVYIIEQDGGVFNGDGHSDWEEE